jgi:coenzyme F420-reducing hydrogenase gamma subunit
LSSRQGFCLQKKGTNRFKHHTFKNQGPRKTYLTVKQYFQTRAKQIEELKNVDYFSNGCLPAADDGHAQHQPLLLWIKSSELL